MGKLHAAQRGSAAIVALLWVALSGPGPALAAGSEPCAPWPGEPAPLPNVASQDAFAAAWATARLAELSRAARGVEAVSRHDARRLWQHALCLDASSTAARDGILRSWPVRVHRPAISRADAPPEVGSRQALDAALAALSAPVGVWELPRVPAVEVEALAALTPQAPDAPATQPVARAQPEAPAPPPTPPRVEVAIPPYLDGLLETAEAELRQARFEQALDALAQAREQLAALPGGDAVRERAARLEVLAATAEVALGREAEARESFARALRADPALALDARSHSPKVLRALDAARSAEQEATQ